MDEGCKGTGRQSDESAPEERYTVMKHYEGGHAPCFIRPSSRRGGGWLPSFLLLAACAAVLVALLCCAGCGPLKIVPSRETPRGESPREEPRRDPFSRTYNLDFASFQSRLNTALQDYAAKNRGNSFRVALLGSKEFILRGRYRKGEEVFPLKIIARPAGARSSRMEIQFQASNPAAAPAALEKAAAELFRIVEKGAGLRP